MDYNTERIQKLIELINNTTGWVNWHEAQGVIKNEDRLAYMHELKECIEKLPKDTPDDVLDGYIKQVERF